MNAAAAMRGILAMVASMACFISNDTMLKLMVAHLPVAESLGLRSVFASGMLLALVLWQGHGINLPYMGARRVVLRSGLDATTTFTYVIALAVLPIASSTTIYMAAPLITTALSVPMLGEKVDLKRWCAILVGFAGAIVVTRPDPATFSILAALPLVAAFCGSLRDIGTRNIGKEVPGPIVALASAVMLGLVALPFSLWEDWRIPNLRAILLAAGSATAFSLGNLLLIYAFRHAPVATLSPLRYVLVPGALFSGLVVFGDLPDAWASAGTVLVVGSGLYSIQNEARRTHAARQAEREAARSYAGGAPLAGAITRAPPDA